MLWFTWFDHIKPHVFPKMTEEKIITFLQTVSFSFQFQLLPVVHQKNRALEMKMPVDEIQGKTSHENEV